MTTSPTQSLITDVFPPSQRGTAFSIWLVGASLGLLFAFGLGGWAVKEFGWRNAFYLAAIPGLILAPIVYFTLRDVRRGLSDGAKKEVGAQPSFRETFKTLMSIRTIPYLMVSATVSAFVVTGLLGWIPAFLARTHHLSASEVGARLGGALALGSLIGHLIGGPLMDVLGRWDLRAHVWIGFVAGILSAGIGLLVFTVPADWAFPLIGLQILISGISAAPMIAVLTTLAPPWARSTAMALLMVLINGVGFGAGPAFIGALSDFFKPQYGEGSLQMALLCAMSVSVPAAICSWIASTHYRKDHAAAMARLGPGAVMPTRH